MSAEQPPKDLSPMIVTRRIKRMVQIREMNHPPSSLFDVTVQYPSIALPDWFKGLQSIVEDETFTTMTINLGGRTYYRLTIVRDLEP
jgi:hypothetical protein